MKKTLNIGPKYLLQPKIASCILDVMEENQESSFIFPTGRSPIGAYLMMPMVMAMRNKDFSKANAYYLDEYFGFIGVGTNGESKTYKDFAIHHLNVLPREMFSIPKDKVFQIENIHTPRGSFYEKDKLVTSRRLTEIFLENPKDYELRGLETEEIDEDNLIERYGIKTPLETLVKNGKTVRKFRPEIHIPEDARNSFLIDVKESYESFESRVRKAKPRMAMIGIGVECHPGFNENGTYQESTTHIAILRLSTIKANEDDFKSDVSWYAITQGISTIMCAQEIMLLAFGKTKAGAIYNTLLRDPSSVYPASYIQNHPNVRLYVDNEAFEKCRGKLDELERRGWEVKHNE